MTLFLTESEVASLVSVPELVDALEQAFRDKAAGLAGNVPRGRAALAGGTVLHVMSAAWGPGGVAGLKAYTTSREGGRFVVLLYDERGRLVALLQADTLGQRRTGAATGLATRYLAREDARTVAVIGAGWQARTQLEAVCAVRPVERAWVFSRTAERRERFAQEMSQHLGLPVLPASSAEEAVRAADVVCTITTARDPVVLGRWLPPGVHVNAAGSNWAHRRELDAEAVARAHRVVVDDLPQARGECGDLIQAAAEGAFEWDRAAELGDVVAGKVQGRASPQEVTLFCSQGIALEDVVAARLVYERARARGVGRQLDLGLDRP
ncbi:MAG: ornithine cyclodeaminase family protein [Armatimonadota bacterium]|nr:ornithine cyclodeaminase family protein [Armatimonadota bacterium]MDR5675291.1 ornithine cyclodeaminase family protein [Armatimonadota bacterium]MDR5688929.1 ornithine cyclodeaminase family protein [Armatimonadota bacterium]MDR7387553.1 ornithine cyclodeaminase family protein [Armatimonadota bacterium]MDR7389466.1 ornithine cyclodeaminase family protein [Armatimonadota bacterium]